MNIIFICILLLHQELSLYLPDKIQDYKSSGPLEQNEDTVSNTRQVIRTYSNDLSELTIYITDYSASPGILAATQTTWKNTPSYKDNEMSTGLIDIDGLIAQQTIQKEIMLSEVSVIIKDKFLITFQCINAPENEARKVALSYNYNWFR